MSVDGMGSASRRHLHRAAPPPAPTRLRCSACHRFGQTLAGGKGANQACCIDHLAHPSYFVGQVGDALRGSSIGLDRLARVAAAPMGHAVVMLLPDGQNFIIIVGGANMWGWLDELRVDDLEAIKTAGIVLLQREIPNRQHSGRGGEEGVPMGKQKAGAGAEARSLLSP